MGYLRVSAHDGRILQAGPERPYQIRQKRIDDFRSIAVFEFCSGITRIQAAGKSVMCGAATFPLLGKFTLLTKWCRALKQMAAFDAEPRMATLLMTLLVFGIPCLSLDRLPAGLSH